ncbi:MAG: twin-arginine translocase subunit TatC [Desulfatitalea sp.]|nr:twin-arginine translocase subunit TatC [Desulfatitalea sp.]
MEPNEPPAPDSDDSAPRSIALLALARKAVIRAAVVTCVLAVGGYYCAEKVLAYLQRLSGAKLVAYSLPDTFIAFLMIALALGLTAAMPYTLYALLSALHKFRPAFTRQSLWGFWSAAVILFALGMFFCLAITLPYGIQFLLSFESAEIVALISVKKFVSFCFWVVFGFGLIFELPLVMMLLARIGLVNPKQVAGYRRYALVIILIIAAIVTPTPDILNLMLMAVPLYLLFEIGLIGMRFWNK